MTGKVRPPRGIGQAQAMQDASRGDPAADAKQGLREAQLIRVALERIANALEAHTLNFVIHHADPDRLNDDTVNAAANLLQDIVEGKNNG